MTAARAPHVLVVAYNFPPHAAIGTMRTLRLVRYLAEQGWSIEVLTSDPRTFRASTPVDDALLSRVPPQVRVVRAASWRWLDGRPSGTAQRPEAAPAPSSAPAADVTTPALPQGRMSRWSRMRRLLGAARAIPDRENSWLAPSVLAGLRHCRRPDVLYSSSPPWTGQLTALALARRWRCPWVADFRDPWARAPWREDRPPFAVRVASDLERRVVRRADRILFTTEGNRRDFTEHYGQEIAARFEVVANGCDVSEFAGLQGTPDPERFVLLHPGSLYGGRRDPAPLFQAVARAVAQGAISRRGIVLRFLGADAPARLAAIARSHGIEDLVEILPRVERAESLRQMVSASALLIIQPGHGVSVPGKLYEYFAAGRPVFALTEDQEIAALVRDSGAGIVSDPYDVQAIERSFVSLVQGVDAGSFVPATPALFDGQVQAAAVGRIMERLILQSGPTSARETREETGRIHG